MVFAMMPTRGSAKYPPHSLPWDPHLKVDGLWVARPTIATPGRSQDSIDTECGKGCALPRSQTAPGDPSRAAGYLLPLSMKLDSQWLIGLFVWLFQISPFLAAAPEAHLLSQNANNQSQVINDQFTSN